MARLDDSALESLGRGEKVLCCGTDGPATLAMAELLARAGFRVTTVDPVALFETVRVERPAVVVLRLEGDRRLLGLADILRGDPLGRRTGIVITWAGREVSHAEALAAGANAAYEEPVPEAGLVERVARLAGVPRRTRMDVPVTLVPLPEAAGGDAGDVIRGRMVEASETGLLLAVDAALHVDASYLVQARVARGDFVLRARVVRQAGERGPSHFGVVFQHAPELMRHAVAQMRSGTLAAHAGRAA